MAPCPLGHRGEARPPSLGLLAALGLAESQ